MAEQTCKNCFKGGRTLGGQKYTKYNKINTNSENFVVKIAVGGLRSTYPPLSFKPAEKL